jgi:hypothetical protein
LLLWEHTDLFMLVIYSMLQYWRRSRFTTYVTAEISLIQYVQYWREPSLMSYITLSANESHVYPTTVLLWVTRIFYYSTVMSHAYDSILLLVTAHYLCLLHPVVYHVLKAYLRTINTTIDYKTDVQMLESHYFISQYMFRSAEINIRWCTLLNFLLKWIFFLQLPITL